MASKTITDGFNFEEYPLTPTSLVFERSEIEASLPARFERVVEQFPYRTAIQAGEASLNYAELNARANRLAHAILEKRGPGSEPISFVLSNPETQITAMLGILKAGKMYLPLQATYPVDRLRFMQADTQAGLVLTDGACRSLACQLAQEPDAILALDELDPELPAITSRAVTTARSHYLDRARMVVAFIMVGRN